MLTLALDYTHKSGLAHRDIKAEHCLWHLPANGERGLLKLADFGLAEPARVCSSTEGSTPEYAGGSRAAAGLLMRGIMACCAGQLCTLNLLVPAVSPASRCDAKMCGT